MNQELAANNEYVANDEIMDEKILALAQQLMSSYVISPTSEDLTFDERIFELPNINTAAELSSKKLSNSINTFKTPTHASPPGFSNVPQYSPLTLDIPNPEHLMRPQQMSMTRVLIPTSVGCTASTAPTYRTSCDYPEFVELPTYRNL